MNKRQAQRPDALPRECTPFPRRTPEQERALIEQARAGEDVRDQIILSLQRRIHALAWKLVSPTEEQEEHRDLVQSANLALLKWFDTALSRPDPYRYLLRVARSAMFDFFRGSKEAYSQRERIPVVSLDEPFREDGAFLADLLSTEQEVSRISLLREATDALLHQAIAALPEKQRLVIERHYGFGQAPQSLNALKQGTSSKYHHSKALATLRTALAAQLPQYTAGGVQ